jgi:hypothetical protein
MQISSTGKICTLAKTRGLYVCKKGKNTLLKDCKISHLPTEGENTGLQAPGKPRNPYTEVVQKSELRPT